MTRYDFGGDGTQAIFDLTTGNPLQNATDGVVYASLTATSPLVDITIDQGGTTFLDNVSTNVHGVLGRFYGPDNVKQVAVDFGSGERFLIDSNTGRRQALDATTDIQAALDMADAAVPSASMGQPLGPAQLGTDGRLPYEQLPTDINAGAGVDVVVNGKAGPNIQLTPEDVGARSSAVPVPVGDVGGLAKVATSGAYADLAGTPAPAVAVTTVGSANGVAPLDANKKVPLANLPDNLGGGTTGGSVQFVVKSANGTWAPRPTADPAVMVIWKGPDPSPAVVTSGTSGMRDGIDVRFWHP